MQKTLLATVVVLNSQCFLRDISLLSSKHPCYYEILHKKTVLRWSAKFGSLYLYITIEVDSRGSMQLTGSVHSLHVTVAIPYYSFVLVSIGSSSDF